MPPRRTASIAVLSAASRSTPATCMTFSMIASGTTAVAFCARLASGEPCASMPTASMTASGPRPSVSVADRADDVVLLGRVDDRDAARAGPREPLGDDVGAEDLPGAQVQGDAGGHVADRAQAEDEHAAALRDAGVLHRLPRGGQDVGEVDEAVVRRALGHLDRQGVAERHPQVLRLAAGHLAVELRVAEQRGAEALLAVLRRLALGLQALGAHPAGVAGDVERDDDAVAGLHRGDLGADLADDPHRLVAHHVARPS